MNSTWIQTNDGVLLNLATGMTVDMNTSNTLTFTQNGTTVAAPKWSTTLQLMAAFAAFAALVQAAPFSPAVPPAFPKPTLLSISPATCAGVAGATPTLTGTGFDSTGGATIGGVALVSPVFTDSTTFSFTLSPGALSAGTYDVVYIGPDGQTATLAGGFVVT